MRRDREELLNQYEQAVRAFKKATERSTALHGADLYEAMREIDWLYGETQRLEQALAEYDKAMR